jgi:hypothetical protein
VSGCANCEAVLVADQRFCGACGQKVLAGRFTMGQIGQDFLHALTHVDHSVFALIKGLLIRPGVVAREYIDGKRKKYFGPFAFLVIMVGLSTFVILLLGIQWFQPIPDKVVANLLQRHFNLVVLMQVPLIAVCSLAFFWRERLFYAEHLVFVAYTSGLRVLFLAVTLTPLMFLTGADTANFKLFVMFYGLWLGYFAFASTQFYRGNRAWTACKAVLAAALGWALTVTIIFVFIWLFARFAE